jgi:hypothetical protein
LYFDQKNKLIVSVKIRHLTETEYILIQKIKNLDAKYTNFYAKKDFQNGGDGWVTRSQKNTLQKY